VASKWVRIAEYARRYGVAPSTLRRWEEAGARLPVRRSGSGQRLYDLTIPPGRGRYDREESVSRVSTAAPPTRARGQADGRVPKACSVADYRPALQYVSAPAPRGIVLDVATLSALGRAGYTADNLIRGEVPEGILSTLRR
jgi:transposase-like protein